MLIRNPEWIWEGKEAAVIGQKGLFLLFENFCNISKFTSKLDIDRLQHVFIDQKPVSNVELQMCRKLGEANLTIKFGTCKVRRLKRAKRTLLYKMLAAGPVDSLYICIYIYL